MVFKLFENLSPREALGLTIYGEARGESIEGQVAVACVIRNRMQEQPGKYKSYNNVVFEPKQFSCWNEDDPNYAILLELTHKIIYGQLLEDIYLKQCFWVAQGVMSWSIIDNTHGSVHYLAEKLWYSTNRPDWSKNPSNIPKKIGNQVFFNV